jgi:serine/threonine protein kinase
MPSRGEIFKQFKLLDPLGKGGMGQVFLAEDTALDRKVALKFLPKELEEERTARERFLREAKAAAALDHPYICKIYEIGEVESRVFIAMEFVDGVTLHRRLASGALSISHVLDLGAELAEAVDAAHRKQIVHRDIKTANVMVTPDGHVKILDFGLARMLAMEALAESKVDTYSGRLSSDHSSAGTVIYMSPEQVRGEPIDGRTDIFSLGVVLYEMATANVPFQGATSGLIYDAILNLGPRPPRYHNPQLPEELERIILKCLEKEKKDRYQSAGELMEDLKRLKQSTESASRPAFKAPVARRSQSSLAKYGLAALAAGLLLASGILYFRSDLKSTSGAPATTDAIGSLAVLPFENTRANPDIDYLTEGIAETLINRLSSLPQLSVKARSSSFRYRGRDVDPQQAGRELGVGAVLTGRVVQQGDTLNVHAELVDVSSGSQIWGEQYDRDVSDLVAVQNELAQEISRALQLQLTGEQEASLNVQGTTNSAAFRAYWKGRFHWNQRTREDFKRAISFFETAMAEDESFALARVGLADSYLLIGTQFYGPDSELPTRIAMSKARSAAMDALRLDPELAEAYVTLAYIEFLHDRNWEAAETNFLRAIELGPDYPVAHQWYSEFLMVMGRDEDALVQARQALALEPGSPILSRELAFRLFQAERYPEAIAQFQATLELDPAYSSTRALLADAYWENGMREEAAAQAELADESRGRLYRLMADGKWEETRAFLDSLSRDEFTVTMLAGFYAYAGDKEKAFDLLEEAFEREIPQLLITLQRPVFRGRAQLRSEPRLVALRERLGLEP